MGNVAPEVSTADYLKAVGIIKSGGVVAFPTETSYGLAVDPFNEAALKKLFSLKGRASDKAILVLIENPDSLSSFTGVIPEIYRKLMDGFWPGPLTLVFEGQSKLPGLLTDVRGTVGIRWSSHPVACRLAGLSGGVITGTSANLSGLPAAVTADQVAEIFPEGVDFIIDGGPVPGGKGSTIVGRDIQADTLCLIRDGSIPFMDITAEITG
jgi:L-threonylcarbamoyladenylate synthase